MTDLEKTREALDRAFDALSATRAELSSLRPVLSRGQHVTLWNFVARARMAVQTAREEVMPPPPKNLTWHERMVLDRPVHIEYPVDETYDEAFPLCTHVTERSRDGGCVRCGRVTFAHEEGYEDEFDVDAPFCNGFLGQVLARCGLPDLDHTADASVGHPHITTGSMFDV